MSSGVPSASGRSFLLPSTSSGMPARLGFPSSSCSSLHAHRGNVSLVRLLQFAFVALRPAAGCPPGLAFLASHTRARRARGGAGVGGMINYFSQQENSPYCVNCSDS